MLSIRMAVHQCAQRLSSVGYRTEARMAKKLEGKGAGITAPPPEGLTREETRSAKARLPLRAAVVYEIFAVKVRQSLDGVLVRFGGRLSRLAFRLAFQSSPKRCLRRFLAMYRLPQLLQISATP
jgi:hypothetical protein